MNDNDQFEAMDEISDWAVANAKLLSEMDRTAQVRKHFGIPRLRALNKAADGFSGTDSCLLDP